MNGYQGSDRFDSSLTGPEMLRFAAGPRYGGIAHHGIRAEGASTASIANIISNVMNKFMLQGYLFTEQTWRLICAIKPVNDYKPTKSINLLGDVRFLPVPPSGEIVNASISDQAFSNQAGQYARILTINEKNWKNDDLGILTTAPLKIGQGAGLSLNDVFWAVFLALASANADDGNSFWNNVGNTVGGTHGSPPGQQQTAGANLVPTGAGSALSSASLGQAKQLLDKQVDPDGNPIGFHGVKPTLLYPPELWETATELVDPSAIGLVYGGSSSSTSKVPDKNVWANRFQPAMSAYLSNSNYTGNSTTAWYALLAAQILAVMEACFVDGVDTPTVQIASEDFMFDRLGISMRGRLNFGCNGQNFRGGVKSNGS